MVVAKGGDCVCTDAMSAQDGHHACQEADGVQRRMNLQSDHAAGKRPLPACALGLVLRDDESDAFGLTEEALRGDVWRDFFRGQCDEHELLDVQGGVAIL